MGVARICLGFMVADHAHRYGEQLLARIADEALEQAFRSRVWTAGGLVPASRYRLDEIQAAIDAAADQGMHGSTLAISSRWVGGKAYKVLAIVEEEGFAADSQILDRGLGEFWALLAV